MSWTPSINEIFIAQHAIDFRKGANGLLAVCYAMELDPYAGDCVVFIHRSRRAVKVICGDAHGLWLLLRRFEGGALRKLFPFLADPAFVQTTKGELALLLEGATCEVTAVARPWKSPGQGDKAHSSMLNSRPYERKSQSQDQAAAGAARGIRQGLGVGEGTGHGS